MRRRATADGRRARARAAHGAAVCSFSVGAGPRDLEKHVLTRAPRALRSSLRGGGTGRGAASAHTPQHTHFCESHIYIYTYTYHVHKLTHKVHSDYNTIYRALSVRFEPTATAATTRRHTLHVRTPHSHTPRPSRTPHPTRGNISSGNTRCDERRKRTSLTSLKQKTCCVPPRRHAVRTQRVLSPPGVPIMLHLVAAASSGAVTPESYQLDASGQA